MKKNVGFVDRIVRFVFIDLLLGFSLVGFEIPMVVGTIAFLTCVIIAVPTVLGYSPLYHLLGISTNISTVKQEASK